MTSTEPGKPANRSAGAAASRGGAGQSQRRRRKIELSGDRDWLARRSVEFLLFSTAARSTDCFCWREKHGRCKVSPWNVIVCGSKLLCDSKIKSLLECKTFSAGLFRVFNSLMLSCSRLEHRDKSFIVIVSLDRLQSYRKQCFGSNPSA